jgi:hypothetical protein
VGKPVFDRQLAVIPSLVALKHVMNVTPGMAKHWRPIKYTELPEEMIVGHLKFQLRGVVLANTQHFISLVFVENMLLWYDGMSNYGQPGPQLMVFSRYDSGGQTSSYSSSLMYYKVTPLNDEGATLISKSEGVLNQNYNSLGSVVDDNADGADDSSNSSFEEEKTIQRKDATQDQKHRQIFQNEFPSDDSVEIENDTPTESLLKFYTQNKKKVTMTMAQQKQSESKKNPVRMTKGFSLVTKLDTRRKCVICKTYMVKGNCAIHHCTVVGKRTGTPMKTM